MAHTCHCKEVFLLGFLFAIGLNIVPYLRHCAFLVDFHQHKLPVLVVEQPQAVGVVEELEQEQEVHDDGGSRFWGLIGINYNCDGIVC